ncbi:hypothetical protein B0I37DRAFT_374061 [Chaetomium sp. MPI-CAGE-AT-0009]|nr:hypothetical protein B0I37DRAFT_374061 [Chaetomium sp. MPI-CAGE-AT-0009]
MQGERPQQRFDESDRGAMRPPYARSHSHVFETNTGNGISRDTMSAMEANGRPSHLHAGSYTAHARSSSRTSWDGVRVPRPASRTPPQSPPRSPALRSSNRPRPLSAISLPDHSLDRPTALPNRWSYDRERMPSPPPPARGSRPGTPLSDWEALEVAFSRPASTLIESRSSSRPPSLLLSDQGGHSHSASTPTLRVHPPPLGENPQQHLQGQHSKPRQPYHLLTAEEMELLAHPPPLQPPMTASPQSPQSPQSPHSSTTPLADSTAPPKHPTRPKTSPNQQLQPHTTTTNTTNNNINENENEKESRCTNLCELTPARQICGGFGAWVVGMAVPVTFAAVSGCLGVCR